MKAGVKGESMNKFILFLVLMLLGINAFASLPSNLPGSALPERIGEERSIFRGAPKPSIGAPPVIRAGDTTTTLSKEAQKVTFVLKSVVVKGATALDVKPFYTPYLNKRITVAQLYGIADSITKAYRDQGYILSRAILPPQSIKEGVVEIRVIEGFIQKLEIEGGTKKAQNLIKKYLSHVIGQKPLSIYKLERYVLLANDLSGVSAKTILRASKTTPEAADLIVAVNVKHYSFSADYSNRGSEIQGPQEFSFVGGLYDILTAGDRTVGHYLTTPDGEKLKFMEINHRINLGSEGMHLSGSTSRSISKPGGELTPLEFKGVSETQWLELFYPALRTRSHTVYLSSRLKFLHSTTEIFHKSNPTRTSEDFIRTLSVRMGYHGADKWRGQNSASFAVTRGLPLWGSNDTHNSLSTRPKAPNTFTHFTLNASRLQALGNHFFVYLTVKAQHSLDPLFASEEFSVGGEPYGSAYDGSEILGDSGVAGRAELQTQPFITSKTWRTLMPYVFYDAGKVWNIKPSRTARTQPDRKQLRSAGIGFRMHIKHVHLAFELAKPLARKVETLESEGKNSRKANAFFRISVNI